MYRNISTSTKRPQAGGALMSVGAALLFALSMPIALAEEDGLKNGAKKVGHAAGTVVREVGQGAKKVGKTIGEAAKEGSKEFHRAIKGERR